MASTTFTVAYDNTSDVTYRAWITPLVAALDALPGWQRVAAGTVAGQINVATAVRSNLQTTNFGVWESTDGLTKVYVRIVFNNTQSVVNPGFVVSAGWAIDAAGNITGTQKTSIWRPAPGGEAIARDHIISGAAGRMLISMGATATTTFPTTLILIERSRDGAGASSDAGLTVAVQSGSALFQDASGSGVANAIAMQYVPRTGSNGPAPFEPRFIIAMSNNTTSVYATNIGFGPVIPWAGGMQAALLSLICYNTADVTALANVTVPVYGTSRAYFTLAFPNGSNFLGVGSATTSNVRLAVIKE